MPGQREFAKKALRLKQANDRRTQSNASGLDFSDYPDELLTAAEAGEILGISPATLANWRWAGKGPRYVRINRQTIRYPKSALADFAHTELRVREHAGELSDAELIAQIARLATRLARRQRQEARVSG
jgi:Helix-turn-helix domain